MATGFVTTHDGCRLYFESRGNSGKPLVLANGTYLLDDFASLVSGHTLIAFDFRNRGRSDSIRDPSRLGVDHDVEDIEAIRRHFGIAQLNLIGHSYVGLVVGLYAMRYAAVTDRVVQIAPSPPGQRQYPAHLSNHDGVLARVMGALAKLQQERASHDPVDLCRKFWSVLREIYVTNPADAHRADWGRCDLINERNALRYLTEIVYPSIARLDLKSESAKATRPILIVHGTKDRSAPYGGGRDWALTLSNARLLSIADAGHAPWIEAPDLVFESIREFLNGAWPSQAEQIKSLDPAEADRAGS
jgi:pimeloyl-ACP methyl ester carboxylesterase